MKLSMDILLDSLKSWSLKPLREAAPERRVEGLRMLYAGISDLDARYLYIGVAEDLRALARVPDGAHLILCGPLACGAPAGERYDLYATAEPADFGRFFNDAEDAFSFYESWAAELSRLSESKADLQKFVDISDEALGYPVSIIDYSESTLALSRAAETGDEIVRSLRDGHIRTELLRRDSIQGRDLISLRAASQLYSTVSGRYLLARPLEVNGRIAGYASLHMPSAGKERFSQGAADRLDLFAGFICRRMESDAFFSRSFGMLHEYLMSDLIARKVVDHEVIDDRASFLNWSVEGRRRMLCVEPADAKKRPDALANMRRDIEAMLPGCKCVLHGETVAVMEEKVSETGQLPARLCAWITESGARCGVSNTYALLYDTADYFLQSQKAIRFGRVLQPEKRVLQYCDCMFMHASELLSEQVDLYSLLHPSVRLLLTLYGPRHFLLDTLKAYLQNERNLTLSAKQLFVHRNTMIYRLEKLDELMTYDLQDYNTRAQILFSLDLLDYMLLFSERAEPSP